MDKISVIVPVYNTYPYLRQCLESIINQTYKNLEIIIVNDASPYIEDDEICKEYASKDERIIYIRHEINKGLGGARNTGIKAATGKYIAFVDSDDFLTDLTAYEESMDILNNNNDIDMIFYKFNFYENNLYKECLIEKIDYNKMIELNKNGMTIHLPAVWFKIYKREDIINNNIFFLEKVKFEDLDFWYRYQIAINPVVYGIEKEFYAYRQQDGSIMHNRVKYLKDYRVIFLNMIKCYRENKNIKARKLLLSNLTHFNFILSYMDKLDNETFKEVINDIAYILKSIEITEEEFRNTLGYDFYSYLFCDKYVYDLYKETKKKINSKYSKYMFINENIVIYKIKREIKRLFRKIGGIFKWKN